MSRPSRIAIVKELGSRKPRCLAAHAASGQEPPKLVVVERYPATLGADVLAVIEEDTRELSTLEHANLASLIATVKLKGDVAVLSEWVDGESLAVLLAAPEKPPIEALVWVIVDVLEGLAALHARDRVCGALTPADVFVGADGKTRVTRFALGRVAPELLSEPRLAYMSPEFLRGERSARGDVFTVGVLARECLKGVAELTPVIERAVAAEPAARFATAHEMAAAIKSALAGKMGTRAVVSQYIARTFGEAIQARVAKLEPKFDVSLSMNAPMTTEPPPAVHVPPAAKTPEPAPAVVVPAAAKTPEPAPAVVVPPPAKMPVVALTPEPKAEKSPAPKPVAEKLTAAAKPVPADKPSEPKLVASAVAQAAPAPAPKAVASKVLSLGKRAPSQPDAAPVAVAARKPVEVTPEPKAKRVAEPTPAPAKANGHGAPKAGATPAEVAPVEVKMPSIPVTMGDLEEPPPVSGRDDLDDIDVVSVRPPPAPIVPKIQEVAPKKQEVAPKKPKPEPEPTVSVSVRDVPTVRPPPPPPSARADEEESAAPATWPRSVLFFCAAVVLFGGGFLAGRFTAPEEPAPLAPPPAATPTVTVTATSAPRPSELPTASAVTSASTAAAPNAAPSTEASGSARPRPSAAPSAVYEPHGI